MFIYVAICACTYTCMFLLLLYETLYGSFQMPSLAFHAQNTIGFSSEVF